MNDLVIVVKDFEAEIVEKFLQLVYVGKTNLTDMAKLRQVEDFAAKQFGVSNLGPKGNFSVTDAINSSENKSNAGSNSERSENEDKSNELDKSIASTGDPLSMTLKSTGEPAAVAAGPSGAAVPSGKTPANESLFESESFLKNVFADNGDDRQAEVKKEQIKREYGAEDDDDLGLVIKRCRFCDVTFDRYTDLISHFEGRHPKQNPFGCNRCEKSFTRKFDLTNHIKSRHQNKNVSKCDECGEFFSNRHSRRKHQILAHGFVPLSNSSLSGSGLDVSKSEEKVPDIIFKPEPGLDDSPKEIKCQKCSVSLEDENEALTHYRTVHKVPVIGICLHCQFFFTTEKSYTCHVKLHDPTRPFDCKICKLRFSLAETLQRHINTVHEKSRPFFCSICDKSFGLRSTLKNHIQLVHNINVESKKLLPQKRSLAESGTAESSENEETFDGKRKKPTQERYQCSHCQQAFPYKFELEDHVELCPLVGPGRKDANTERAIEETISHLDDISKELSFIFQEPSP